MYLGPPNPPPGPFRAVLFDVDGTLVDSADLIADCLEHACRVHLGCTHPRETYYSLIGRPAAVQMQMLGGGEQSEAMVETSLEHYFANMHREQAFPGAIDTMARLAEVNIRQGLVTSKTRIELNPTLRQIPLHAYVQVVITADQTTRPKPYPDPIYLALQTLQIPAEEVLFIGDSPYDMQAGRAAGVRTAAATWGPHPLGTLEAEGPDYVLRSFRDVIGICLPTN